MIVKYQYHRVLETSGQNGKTIRVVGGGSSC